MNCWILLLLLFCNGGFGGCNTGNNCGHGAGSDCDCDKNKRKVKKVCDETREVRDCYDSVDRMPPPPRMDFDCDCDDDCGCKD